MSCKYGDPLCPCPDGDMCHYEGVDPWPLNDAYARAEIHRLRAVIMTLFPSLEPLSGTEPGDWVDKSIAEIDGAIYDIERAEGLADEVCLRTLKRVSRKIGAAEHLLKEHGWDRYAGPLSESTEGRDD